MDLTEIQTVHQEMNKCTGEFIEVVSTMLQEQFAPDTCSMYLHKMIEHLDTFYVDVIGELAEKKQNLISEIDGLYKEAIDLKTALNINYELTANDNNQLPLKVYLDTIDNELVEMRELYNKRREEIEDYLAQQKILCDSMAEPIRKLALDPLAPEADVREFGLYLIDLKSEKSRRLAEIEELQREIGNICSELDITISDSIQKDLVPTKENLITLRDELHSLHKKRDSIRRECKQMIDKLEVLWDCLDEPESTRSEFRDLAHIFKQSSLDKIDTELKRCKTIKQENIKLFVDKLRPQIVTQWDKIYRSQADRNKFIYFHSDVYTEDLLALHEIELEDCQRFYEENKLIFEKFAERRAWWEKKKELEAKQNEPGRFNNRGGQLLLEEKQRKQVNAKIPDIEDEILKLVNEYQDQHNKEFLINGEHITDVMERDWEHVRASKEQLKSARKGTTSATPIHRAGLTPRTPMSARNHSTIKRLPSTTNLASASGNAAKKRLLEGSVVVNQIPIITITSSDQNGTKRNLLTQLNNANEFLQPLSVVKQSNRSRQAKVVSSLAQPNRRRSNNMNVASKILKKYRRSSSNHVPRHSGTDDSLVNYDIFENQMKNKYFSNSSVLEQQENINRTNVTRMQRNVQVSSRLLKTPNRNNNTFANNTRSVTLSSSSKKLKTKNLGLII